MLKKVKIEVPEMWGTGKNDNGFMSVYGFLENKEPENR
jgi:hypothetical protein